MSPHNSSYPHTPGEPRRARRVLDSVEEVTEFRDSLAKHLHVVQMLVSSTSRVVPTMPSPYTSPCNTPSR